MSKRRPKIEAFEDPSEEKISGSDRELLYRKHRTGK